MTRVDPEWAIAIASLTISEKVRIKPTRRPPKEIEKVWDVSSTTSFLNSLKPLNENIVQDEGSRDRVSEEDSHFWTDTSLIQVE